MQLDHEQMYKDGYLILKGIVPPSKLEELRTSAELLISRYPKYPSRVDFGDEFMKPDTTNLIDFCLHENTLGVSRQLMSGSEAAISSMEMLINPLTDKGPAAWHRDYSINYNAFSKYAPLRDVEIDSLANGPASVQWNIALYDDSVLWVVPGSHSRIDTPEEDLQLQQDPHVPLPGGIPVELSAGDGVVYNNAPILHWGSNYSSKLRRTIHLVYNSFGSPMLPWVWWYFWNLTFTKHLSPASRAYFERWESLHNEVRDRMEHCLRAILSSNPAEFRTSLAVLHPGEEGRMVCVLMLVNVAYKILIFKEPSFTGMSLADRNKVTGDAPLAPLYENLANRFSTSEANRLWQQFAVLDAWLTLDGKLEPSRRSGKAPVDMDFSAFSSRFGVEEFIASWC